MTDFPVLTAESIFEHAKAHFDLVMSSEDTAILNRSICTVLGDIAEREVKDHPYSVPRMPDWWEDRHNHPEVRKAFRLLLIHAASTYDHTISKSGGITWRHH